MLRRVPLQYVRQRESGRCRQSSPVDPPDMQPLRDHDERAEQRQLGDQPVAARAGGGASAQGVGAEDAEMAFM
jgi:hypothetical protein